MTTAERIAEIKNEIHRGQEEVAYIENRIRDLKVQLADLILAAEDEPEPVAPGNRLFTLVGIKFKDDGKVYDYIWTGEDAPQIGDTVVVESKWEGMMKVEVVRVARDQDLNGCEEDYKEAYPLDFLMDDDLEDE